MTQHYSQAFKKQAVIKVLLRAPNVTIQAIASELGVSCSTLYDWISKMGRNAEGKPMTKEKKLTDWSLEERLDMIIFSLCDIGKNRELPLQISKYLQQVSI